MANAVLDSGAALDAALDYLTSKQHEPYEHQLDAVNALASGDNVLLTSPTGSGKSLVAESAIAGLRAASATSRVVWTAPIKALVMDHFQRLRSAFGHENVGISTGDVAVQPDARILCCTEEILANRVLRQGRQEVDLVVMDEFHYYGDAQRGWAWQIPLIECRDSQFLLMSATMGPTDFFVADLVERTGRCTVEITSDERPVPLGFDYRDTPLTRSVLDLVASGLSPTYVVHFDRNETFKTANDLRRLVKVSNETKARIHEFRDTCRFDTPAGTTLKGLLESGIGIHHSGMLPKYRLLVERLAQEGLLEVICGTDTLGVGINVPIRSVLFTKLCKFDGEQMRLLTKRDFLQIAGRAGRRGYDNRGDVWAQAPRYEIDRAEAARARRDGRKARQPRTPLPGEITWNRETFERLSGRGPAERLRSSFKVSEQMIMTVLDRPGQDGRPPHQQLASLLTDNHESPQKRKEHVRRAITLYQSLQANDILEHLGEPDVQGRVVRVRFSLQDEFALHHPLGLFVPHAVSALDGDGHSHALDVLSIVESSLDDPDRVLPAQRRRARDHEKARLKAAGIDGPAYSAALDRADAPRPLESFLNEQFETFHARDPWIEGEPRPKSVAREIIELGLSFSEFVERYELKSFEGAVVRYLMDVYKGLVQSVPEKLKTDATRDVQTWLGEFVAAVDSSLLEEWRDEQELAGTFQDEADAAGISGETGAFRVAMRAAAQRLVESLGADDGAVFTLDERDWSLTVAGVGLDEVLHFRAVVDANQASPRAMRFEPAESSTEG